jgi:hypothetical protein
MHFTCNFIILKFIRNSWVLLTLVFLQQRAHAQFLDTLQEVFKNKSAIDFRLESRNSFINNNLTLVAGVRLGVAFKRKLRIGGGVSWLKSDVIKTDYITDDNGITQPVPKYLKLAYICYYVDFVFYKNKRWQLSVPIQVGTGLSWFQKNQTYDFTGNDKKYFLLLYEPGITTQFKIFKWFGLGADVGYRFALKNNNFVGETMNSPTYAFKILFWADQLYFELFPKSKISQKRGPAYW